MTIPLIDPSRALLLPMLFEAGLLAVSAVLGLALYNLPRDGSKARAVGLLAVSGVLIYHAAMQLPRLGELWLVLAPVSAMFVGLGFVAGKGMVVAARPSLAAQISALTGEAEAPFEATPRDRGARRERRRGD